MNFEQPPLNQPKENEPTREIKIGDILDIDGEKRRVSGFTTRGDGVKKGLIFEKMLQEEELNKRKNILEAIPEEQLKNSFFNLLHEDGQRKKLYLLHLARKYDVSAEDLHQKFKEMAKEAILFPEKVKHYHRTSIDRFKMIVEYGGFLSRAELKKLKPELKLLWSSNENVMMTRDIYDSDGELVRAGLTKHGVGASGSGVIFAFGRNIMNVETYDAFGTYPTISSAPLKGNCEAIIIENMNEFENVKKILDSHNLSDIKVLTIEEWQNQN